MGEARAVYSLGRPLGMAIGPFILTGVYEASGESADAMYYVLAASLVFGTLFCLRFMMLRAQRLEAHKEEQNSLSKVVPAPTPTSVV